MKITARKIFIILILCMCGIMIIGCKNKKVIISFNSKMTVLNLVGYAKYSLFSHDPNFYCFLEIPSKSFISDQLDYFILFNDVNFGIGVIYKDMDGKIFLIRDLQKVDVEQMQSGEAVLSFRMNPKDFHGFSFAILDRAITLNDVKCVLFDWHSGGVNFFSFRDFREGIISVFKYGIEGKYDANQSGQAIFTEWYNDDDRWPEIKKLIFPLRVPGE